MTSRLAFFNKKFSGLLSDGSRTRKASLNAVASVLDYGARWAVTFLLNPLLVSGLGDFGYGAWQVLERLIAYISPAGGRPTQALKWTIASQQASTDYEEKRRQVGSAVVVWILFLPLLALIGGLLTWYFPGWLETPPGLYPSVRWAAALLVANLVFSNLAEIPQSVLRGENLGYKRMGLSTLFVVLGGGLMGVAMILNAGLIGVALANLITTALTGLLFLQIVRSYVTWFGIARPVFHAVRRFLGLSSWFLAWTLVLQALKAGDVVVLGILDSAELVTPYTLTRYIPETIIGIVAIVVFGITPGLGGIIGQRDMEKANRVRGELMSFTWFIVTVLGSAMLLWNRSFVQLWIGQAYYVGTAANLLIILMVSQFVFIRNDANIIDLTLDLKSKVLLGAFSAGFSAGAAGILVGVFEMGVVGLAMGFIAGQSFLNLGYPLLVGRFLGTSLHSQLPGILRPLLVTIVLFVLSTVLGGSLAVHTWLLLLAGAGLTVGLVAPLALYTGLTGQQRARLLSRVRKALPDS